MSIKRKIETYDMVTYYRNGHATTGLVTSTHTKQGVFEMWAYVEGTGAKTWCTKTQVVAVNGKRVLRKKEL